MVKDYRDVNTPDTEDDDAEDIRRVPPEYNASQLCGRHVCSGQCFLFFLLGLLCLLALLTVVFGFTGRSFHTDLADMEESFKNVNHTLFGALAALKKKETNDLKRLAKVDQVLKNLTEEVKEAKTRFGEHVSKLRTSVHSLNCKLEDVKHNRMRSQATCCPKGWVSFRQSCYWFSTAEKTWEEAKADCENRDSRLVTIRSYQEQAFVAGQAKQRNMWIGLRLVSGTWKWVDGTTYTVRRIDWRPGEPNNYSHYDLGETADCAHLYRDGLWMDEHCMRSLSWVCEAAT